MNDNSSDETKKVSGDKVDNEKSDRDMNYKRDQILNSDAMKIRERAARLRDQNRLIEDSIKKAVHLIDSALKIDKNRQLYFDKIDLLYTLDDYKGIIDVISGMHKKYMNGEFYFLLGVAYDKSPLKGEDSAKAYYKRAYEYYDNKIKNGDYNDVDLTYKGYSAALLRGKKDALKELRKSDEYSNKEDIVFLIEEFEKEKFLREF